MVQNLQPIRVWGKAGPNPPKVVIILEELDLPYEVVDIPYTDLKKPEYLALNPNGRVPYMEDDNTGIKLWESGAIIQYLIHQYDKEHRFSFEAGSPEDWQCQQWLFYQVSGQGPYYGQLAWFIKFHNEQVPSAVERYANEIDRVSGVLDGWLGKQEQQYSTSEGFDGPWLVGNKLSYADMSLLMWQLIAKAFSTEGGLDLTKYSHLEAWTQKLLARDSVRKVLEASGLGALLSSKK